MRTKLLSDSVAGHRQQGTTDEHVTDMDRK